MMTREEQTRHEQESDAEAAAAALGRLAESAKQGDLTLPHAQRYISRAFSLVAAGIDNAKAIKSRGQSAKYLNWLRAVPTPVAAVIALRTCIRLALPGSSGNPRGQRQATIQTLAQPLGRLYELEVKIAEAERVNPLYMKRVHEQIEDRHTKSETHIRATYLAAYEAVMKDGLDSSLTNTEALHLGKFGVQACLDAGLLTQVRGVNSKGIHVTYVIDPEVVEYIEDYAEEDVEHITDKEAGAMRCAPDAWTTLDGGGYLTTKRKALYPLMSLRTVRKSERHRLRKEFTAEKMPLVFEVANYVQSIPFEINSEVLPTILRMWQQGGGGMGLPEKNKPTPPPFPFPDSWIATEASEDELTRFALWKRSAAAHYESLIAWRSKVRELCSFLRTSKQDGKLWFPVFLDKRGRWYYRGTPNPQGSDIAKAVLRYAEKKPLGKQGVYWLKVHVANCYGFDKERFDDRARWTDQNWNTIKNALNEPESHLDVWGDDSPWCMYAAAVELNNALSSGSPETYQSGLVIHMDATCSGLQHFSAMLRDPVGGGFVNLYDDAKTGPKQDIYSKVASNALQSIAKDKESSDQDTREIAEWWYSVGISRKMAKKPVMTYCYGATLRGTVEYVRDFVERELQIPWPLGIRPYDVAQFCAAKLLDGVAAAVPAAEATMLWLKSMARQQPSGMRMEWHAPTGFLVQHDYQAYEEVRVKIRACGLNQTTVREWTDGTRAIPMQNALSPNFVHALDASHFAFTAKRMKDRELSIVGIHDSFGTHACDVSAMHVEIREAFLDLYLTRNVLSEFLWEVSGVGEAPMRGTLDLTKVRESEFFFC